MAENYASAKAQSNTTTVVSADMIGVSVPAVVMRFYTRYCLNTGLWWDDWLALATDVLYFSIVEVAKISILLIYYRIFAISRTLRRHVLVVGVMVIWFWAATTLATIFNCWPIEWSWRNSFSPAPYCLKYNMFWLTAGVIEAVIDIWFIILPMRGVKKLQLSVQKRVGLASVFLIEAW